MLAIALMNRMAFVPLLVTVVLLCGACAGQTTTPPPRSPPSEARNVELVRVENETPEGNVPPQLRVTLQRQRERLRTCLPESNGKVNVVVTRRDDAVLLSFAPDASLDPLARRCILETLSTYDLDDMGSNVGGTSFKPTGYTSVIQVSW